MIGVSIEEIWTQTAQREDHVKTYGEKVIVFRPRGEAPGGTKPANISISDF